MDFLDEDQRLFNDEHFFDYGNNCDAAFEAHVRNLGHAHVLRNMLDLNVVASDLLGDGLFAFFDSDVDPDTTAFDLSLGDGQPLLDEGDRRHLVAAGARIGMYLG